MVGPLGSIAGTKQAADLPSLLDGSRQCPKSPIQIVFMGSSEEWRLHPHPTAVGYDEEVEARVVTIWFHHLPSGIH